MADYRPVFLAERYRSTEVFRYNSQLSFESRRLAPTEVGALCFPCGKLRLPSVAGSHRCGLFRVQMDRFDRSLFSPMDSFESSGIDPTEVDISSGVGILSKSVRRSVIRGRFSFRVLIAGHVNMLGQGHTQRKGLWKNRTVLGISIFALMLSFF
jgi:hypothetical protein